MKFKQFIRNPGFIASIFMGIFYAVAMLWIFLVAYSALPGNSSKLKVAIVNDDVGALGEQIANQLGNNLPFKIERDDTNEQALRKLDDNQVALVIQIPQDFSANVQKGEKAEIDFTVNGATSSVVTSTMKSIVNELDKQLSTSFSTQAAQRILINMNVPEQQAATTAQQIENAYVSNYVIKNEVPKGMQNSMLPMFLPMASYTGAMIASLQLIQAYRQNRGKASRFKLFGYVQLSALIIAIVSAIFELISVYIITDLKTDIILNVAGQQILFYMTAFNLCAIFTFLLGQAGAIVNIPVLLLQSMTNGATMPREMMYGFYEVVSYITPMYYGVNSYYAIMFGSTKQSPFIFGLLTVFAGALLINILIVTFRHEKEPVPKQ